MTKIRNYTRVLMGVGLLGLLVCSCKGKGEGQQSQQQQTPELAVITLGEDDATLETGFPATLQGTNDVEIRPQVSGFITKVCVQEGQHVSAGQTLFMIDRVQLEAAVEAAQAQVRQAEAAIAAARAAVNTARTNAQNNKMLLDKNIISASAYQTSVDAVNQAQAQVNQAQAAANAASAQLVSAKKNLSFANVTAPTSGIVGTIDYKEGALVSPQTLLTVLSNNGQIEALFSLTEKEVLNFTNGGRRSLAAALDSLPAVTLMLPNGEAYPYPGKITAVSGVLDSATGSARARAVFPNPDGMLRSGGSANVMLPNIARNSIIIPQKATYEVQDMKFVYTVDKNNVVHSTAITISDQNDGQNYIVTSGLKPGDRIVTEGVGLTVKDNMAIKPKTGAAAQQSAAPQQPK